MTKYWFAVCEIRDDDMPAEWDTGAETLEGAIDIAEEMIGDGTACEIYRIACENGDSCWDATYSRGDDGEWYVAESDTEAADRF